MTNLQDLKIIFYKPGGTYTPGETVNGKITFNLSRPKNVREIRLEVSGEAEVHWIKKRNIKDSSGRSHRHTDHYKSNEKYFSLSNRLIAKAAGDGETTLPAGPNMYEFAFQLPRNIPCSIEHKYGHVRYVVKAILDRPWKFDHRVLSAFTVIAPCDLNPQQRPIEGINEEIKRTFRYCGCCNAGGVIINVSSRESGYVPGQTIELKIKYDNSSTRVDINKMKLKLIKNMTFHASEPVPDKKYDTEIIKNLKKSGPFGKKGETCLEIEVPSLPPSNLDNCSIINISYQLALTVKFSGLHFNVKRIYSVQLGTIPMPHQMENISDSSVRPNNPSAPPIAHIIPNTPTSQPLKYGFVLINDSNTVPPYPSSPEMPPPTYEKYVTASNEITDKNEQGMPEPNIQLAAKYPVYRLPIMMPCKCVNK